MNYESILQTYIEDRTAEEKVRDGLRTEMERTKARALHYTGIIARKMTRYHALSEQANACNSVRYTTHLVTPLMKEVTRLTGIPFDLSDLRTFGLRAECPVMTTEEEPGMHLTFTFDRRGNRLYLDTGENTRVYDPGSIADINGFNRKTEEVVSVMTVIDNLRRRYPQYDIKIIENK